MTSPFVGGLTLQLWRYFIFKALCNLSFYDAIFFLFYQHRGFTSTQVWTLLSLGSVGMLVFDIPAGAFADAFSRRTSLIAGVVVQILAVGLMAAPLPYYVIAGAQLLFGLGFSLVSGADTAFLYDTLKEQGKEADFKSKEGLVTSVCWLAIAAANFLSGFTYKMVPQFPFLLSAVALMGALAIAFTFRERTGGTGAGKRSTLHNVLRSGAVIRSNRALRWYILYYGLAMALLGAAYWLFQPLLRERGISVEMNGVFYFLFTASSSLSAGFVAQVDSFIGHSRTLLVMIMVPMLALAGLALATKWWSLLILALLIQVVRGLTGPILRTYINASIDSGQRATVISTASFLHRVLQAAIMPMLGRFIDYYTPAAAAILLGGLMAAFGATLWLFKPAAGELPQSGRSPEPYR